jgi:general secretion pathway protein A
MHTDYWKLDRLPFENVPDPDFFYESRAHREAITRLLFAVESHKTMALLTGDYGSGKTVVCQTVIERLPANEHHVAMVTNPTMDATDLTREIISQLGEDIGVKSKYEVLHAYKDVLERHAVAGRHCTAIIDEAQLIANAAILEELRLLLNVQTSQRACLTLILAGQTELNDMIKSIPQMRQRISLKYHIPHLDNDEVAPYLARRLEAAGGQLDIFDEKALRTIERLSNGNPREINALADLSLLFGSLMQVDRIGAEIVQEAGRERA